MKTNTPAASAPAIGNPTSPTRVIKSTAYSYSWSSMVIYIFFFLQIVKISVYNCPKPWYNKRVCC